MKHKNIYLAACLALLSGTCAFADDVYVYSGTDTAPVEVKTIANVKKITFSETAITITDADGTETPVAFADFDFFSFDKKSEGSVADIAANNHIAVGVSNGLLSVKSTAPIEKIELYSTQGVKLLDKAPMSAEFTSQLNIADGIYLVKVYSNGTEEVHKIIK